MKNFLILFAIFIFFGCNKKQTAFEPDSIYNVNSNWETQSGKKIKLADFRGKVLVTAMIYTSCKTACPRLTAEMASIANSVGKVNPEEFQYVLISIDPENDNPAVMRSYLTANNFDEDIWTFIRSNEEDTRELANVMAVKYKELSPMEFSHSNIISVYDKLGKLAYQKEGLSTDGDATLVEKIKQEIKK